MPDPPYGTTFETVEYWDSDFLGKNVYEAWKEILKDFGY